MGLSVKEIVKIAMILLLPVKMPNSCLKLLELTVAAKAMGVVP